MSYREQILSKTVLPPGRLCLAFSGGSDSLALLSLLPKERSYAVYINHNIRPSDELEKEIALNKRNASSFSIPIKIITMERGQVEALSLKEGIGIEAAARKLRYAILEKEDADYVLTAHHMDDQVETILMRLLSGSPFYRLEGIRLERGRIFRPFLHVEKELINAYIDESGLSCSFDSTNSDVRYKRNFIRKNILPLISSKEKRLISSIADNMQQINGREAGIPIKKGFTYSIEKESFLSSSPMRMEEALYKINEDLGFSSLLSRSQCLEVENAVEKNLNYTGPRFLVRTTDDVIRFYPRHLNIVFDGTKSFTWNNLCYEVSDEAFDEKTLIIDFSSLALPLLLRESRECDVIELREGRKKVRDLEKEYGVPYCFVLEDRTSIVAVLARVFGKKDRLARRLLNRKGKACSLRELERAMP